MKIEKCLCDICGGEIVDSRPTRVEHQEYVHEPTFRGYKKVKTYDICKECRNKLPELFKAIKEV